MLKLLKKPFQRPDSGVLRVAEKENGDWRVNDWVKKAILLYFRVAGMQTHKIGPYEFYDVYSSEDRFRSTRRATRTPGHVRYGSFLSGAVL